MTAECPLLDDGRAPVRTLTLNRPKARNALSLELMGALTAAIEAAGADQAVRAVILKAEGPAFCAGHDLKEMTAGRATDDQGRALYEQTFETCVRLMETILTCPVPVIAQVHGIATAAGCQLVATCDLAIAVEGTRFATPGVNIGLFCSTPMVALSRNVSRKAAMEMLLTGEMVHAEDAQAIGLINRVVPADQLETQTLALADTIASKSGKVLRIGKEAFYKQLEMPIGKAYEYTARVMTENMMAAEAEEGIGAFVEKREPNWPN